MGKNRLSAAALARVSLRNRGHIAGSPERISNTPQKRQLRLAMCMKPMFATVGKMHLIISFVEYYLQLGVEHFYFYKYASGALATSWVTGEGILPLLPYVRRGIITILELHPDHEKSGIVYANTYNSHSGGIEFRSHPERITTTH